MIKESEMLQPTIDWIPVARKSEIPMLGARVVHGATAGPIAIFRTSDDEVFAVLDRCPHKGGPLSQGIVAGHAVTCPLHAWTIGLEDGRAHAPDEGCARRYSVRCEGDEVFLARAELALA